MKRIYAVLALVFIAVGCAHPQVPPASQGQNVNLTWQDATCTGCVYAVYAETISSGGSCDPTTSTNWKEITTPTTRPTALAYTDPNSTGLVKCYNVEAVLNGSNSAPSNTAGPVVVPGVPSPPVVGTPTLVAGLVKPEPLGNVQMASAGPINLKLTVSR